MRNPTMNRILFVFVLVIVAAAACKKDDTNVPAKSNPTALVKEIIRYYASVPSDTLKYAYNTSKQISEIAFCGVNATYNTWLKFDYKKLIMTSIEGESNFVLNNNGTLASYTLFNNSFQLTYNAAGYLVSVKGQDRETSPREYTYDYQDGNLVQITGQLGGTYYTYIEYSSVPNKSNLTNIEQEILPSGPYFLGLVGKGNKNLVKQIIHNNYDTLHYEYVLNPDSLVTKMMVNGITTCAISY